MCLFVSIPHLNYYNHLRYWCSRVCLIYVYALTINCFGKSEKYKSDRNILVLLFTRYVLGFFSVRSLTSTIIRRASCPLAPSTTALWTRSTCCAGCRTSSYERWVGRRKHTKKNNPVIKCRIIGGQAGETTQTKTSVE